MSAVLAYYLALEHAREAAIRAPWLDTTLMRPDALDFLHGQADRFRDAYMHFGDKAAREYDFPPAPPTPPGSLPSPRVAVGMAFGFEESGPYLFAPRGPKAHRREWNRLVWADMPDVIDRVESWLLDLLNRWPDIQELWAPYVTTHGHDLT